jgi:hypothetical protein
LLTCFWPVRQIDHFPEIKTQKLSEFLLSLPKTRKCINFIANKIKPNLIFWVSIFRLQFYTQKLWIAHTPILILNTWSTLASQNTTILTNRQIRKFASGSNFYLKEGAHVRPLSEICFRAWPSCPGNETLQKSRSAFPFWNLTFLFTY